ncbi:hypothetical protein TL16_g03226 [Triparma laevis f. inornata]|uniref:START domain-containing protein n=1 Tax=Triparma laevis f. inornata TaxID=1714386 RepID=A0A9W6ZVM5_9STRA|nr:hypothetical protein TL16_g03226 [Triparma laevis f. inornata]
MAFQIDDDLFKLSPLSAARKSAYIEQAKSWLPAMINAVEETEADGWKPCGMTDPTITNGVTLCKKVTEGNPVVMIRGQTIIPNYSVADALSSQKSINTSARLRNGLHANDPMNIDSSVLHVLQKGESLTDDTPLAQIVWAVFQAPGPIWARDFCWLQYVDTAKDSKGREAMVCSCQSIDDFEQCHNLQSSHKFVRGNICTTGYIYTETDIPGEIMITYVVQVDPKGSIPKFVVNLVAAGQGENAGRVRDTTIGLNAILKKFNRSIQDAEPTKAHARVRPIDVSSSLVYANNTCTETYEAEEDGVLEVLIHPTNGDSIVCNGEDYSVDKSTGVPPSFSLDVVKGQKVELVFKNKSSAMFKKFKQVWWYGRVKTSSGSERSIPAHTLSPLSNSTRNKKKGKGMLHKIAKTISPKSKKDNNSFETPQKPEIKIVEKIKVVEKLVHPETSEVAKAYQKGFATGIACIVIAILMQYVYSNFLSGGVGAGGAKVEVQE